MKKLVTLVLLSAAITAAVPAVAAGAKTTPKLVLSMSNFRFCKTASCTPLDVGYLRPGSSPIPGSDNPLATISVKSGTLVSWVYRDALCDALGCPGHNIYFENGRGGVKKGFVPAKSGPKTINVKITQKAGTTIRYFCTVKGHYMLGMTGILHVT